MGGFWNRFLRSRERPGHVEVPPAQARQEKKPSEVPRERPAKQQVSQNETMLEGFEWYLPDDGLLWERTAAGARALRDLGFTMVWLPPACKCQSRNDAGYGIYDHYDLGEFDQKGTIRTKYGTKKAYLQCVKVLQRAGIRVLADIVMNQLLGADETEETQALPVDPGDRNRPIGTSKTILAWTKFTFPGRGGQYSQRTFDKAAFTGVDLDAGSGKRGIYLLSGKQWSPNTDTENGNFDYLCGADLDFSEPSVCEAFLAWGRWYCDTVRCDGFRLDAAKHIDRAFLCRWLSEMRRYTGKDLYAVAEYWSPETGKLLDFAEKTDHTMQLFDAPLHYRFQQASMMWDRFPMSELFADTLTGQVPSCAVTLVENHDTEPDQPLASPVEPWFKPLAYALILLRDQGTPCVFYGDLWGVPAKGLAPVPGLPALLLLRKYAAYGRETDVFDDRNLIGFVREGDDGHEDSGLAAVLTNGSAGTKRLCLGSRHAGELFRDALLACPEPVRLGETGTGDFPVRGGSVSVYVSEKLYRRILLDDASGAVF